MGYEWLNPEWVPPKALVAMAVGAEVALAACNFCGSTGMRLPRTVALLGGRKMSTEAAPALPNAGEAAIPLSERLLEGEA